MKKICRISVYALLMLCLLAFCGVSAEEPAAVTRTGYYTKVKYFRPVMALSDVHLKTVQPYVPVTVSVVDQSWGSAVMEDGTVGYIYLEDMRPLPKYNPIPEETVYSEAALPVWGYPDATVDTVGTLEAWCTCVADGEYGGLTHIRVPSTGLTGYVRGTELKPAELPSVRECSELTVMTVRAAQAANSPFTDAETVITLEKDRFFTAYDGGLSEHLAIEENGRTFYVRRCDVCTVSIDEESMFPQVFSAGGSVWPGAQAEPVFSYANVLPGGTALLAPNREEVQLPAGSLAMVWERCGDVLAVTCGEYAGFAHADRFEIESAAKKAQRFADIDLRNATVEKNEWLDVAFTLVEETNSFRLRYNLATGSSVDSLFPLGVPYFYGGRAMNVICRNYPEYTALPSWQNSPNYYREGTFYLFGFDCIGLMFELCNRTGHPLPNATDLLMGPEYHAEHHILCKNGNPVRDNWAEVSALLQPGDILIVKHPGKHVMQYVGTLRGFGYTEADLPCLAQYLDNPVMIQSGEDPMYYLKLSEYIANSSNPQIAHAAPPDGGACLCILGVPPDEAEFMMLCPHQVYRFFMVEGTSLDIFDFSTVTDYAFYRPEAIPQEPLPLPSETVPAV